MSPPPAQSLSSSWTLKAIHNLEKTSEQNNKATQVSEAYVG